MISASDILVRTILSDQRCALHLKSYIAKTRDPYVQARGVEKYCKEELLGNRFQLSNLHAKMIDEVIQNISWMTIVTKLQEAWKDDALKPEQLKTSGAKVVETPNVATKPKKKKEVIFL